MPILYILCGPSGSGKSTWAHTEMQDTMYVSRDEIRFSMVKDDEDYFSHEKEVFGAFVKAIADRILTGCDTIADATHLNEFSRRKLTQALDRYTTEYEIIYVVFDVGADVCIARNANREGRAKIPEDVIYSMCRNFKYPSMDEDERVKEIIDV